MLCNVYTDLCELYPALTISRPAHVRIRVPTRPGKPGKMRVHLENLENHGILKILINITEKFHETWKKLGGH